MTASYSFEEIEIREAFRENCVATKMLESVRKSCRGIIDDMSFEIMRRAGIKPFFPKRHKTITYKDGSQIVIVNDYEQGHLIPRIIYNLD